MTWAIYCRVSTRDQHPEAQQAALVQYAENRGISYEVFTEKESTRKTRPVKQAVLMALRKRQYAGVIVWKLDRWGRSLQEIVIELEEFNQTEIPFISLQDNIDLSTATGRFMAHLLAVFAEFERDICRERTFLGLEAAKKRGKQLGRPRKTPAGSRTTQWREKHDSKTGGVKA